MVVPLSFFSYFYFLHSTTKSPLKLLPTLSQGSIPNFEFSAHNGKTITRDSLAGKIIIADFFFTTCPGICPRMTSNMKLLQDSIEHNLSKFHTPIRLLSHTVNPSIDSLPVLADYAKLHGVNPKLWWMVTGNKDSLYDICINFYKLPAMDLTGTEDSTLAEPFVHSERFVLLDREGYIRGYYDGTDSAMVAQLFKDLIVLDIVSTNQDKKKMRESLKR
jgi:protein SCO1/2